MAENNEDRNTEDLSDEASPYRLEEYRRKGQVGQSRELVALVLFAFAGFALFSLAPYFGKEIMAFMREVFSSDLVMKPENNFETWVSSRLTVALKLVAIIGLPISLVGFVVGIGTHLTQIGFVFSTEALAPKFDKIDPIQGLQRLFSMRNLIESARLVLKGIILCFVAYGAIRSQIYRSPELIVQHPSAIFNVMGDAGKLIFFSLCGVLLIFALVDFFLQKREFGKQVRVTRQEAKKESKEQEGDPMVKARIRAIQRDASRKRMMAAIKKADVIITNPTHIAIALQYDRDKMVAPRVIAKGADLIAEKIKKIAAENQIVIVENVPLARTLFKSVKLNQTIPRSLFQAVAEVLAFVYKVKNQRFE